MPCGQSRLKIMQRYLRADAHVSGVLKQPESIPANVGYHIMQEIGLSRCPKRKPNGIAEAEREVHKSDDLLKRDFRSAEPLKKCVTEITEIKVKDRKW